MSTTVVDKTGASPLPYTNIDYSLAINVLPNQYGYLSRQGLFVEDELLATEYFEINMENDVITVLPVGRSEARKGSSVGRIFRVPQVEHEDAFTARDIKNMMALFERSRNPETLANQTNRTLARLRKKFDMTREWFRWGALKGIITDGKGAEVLNLFTAFEITQKVVYFDLSDDTTDVEGKCALVYQLISQDLTDESMTMVNVEVDSGFFQKLINHPKVKDKWLASENALALANLSVGSRMNGARAPSPSAISPSTKIRRSFP
ncbi:MAG: major capsid protein [Asticcacaulis sp.]|nr:major capsid protein [Asticcacaulis sp.]